jgi:hypothetical protein
MKKLTNKLVTELVDTFDQYGLFSLCYNDGSLHVPVETFVEYNEGAIVPGVRTSDKYPFNWTRRLQDGLMLVTIGDSADAAKYSLPVPEETNE